MHLFMALLGVAAAFASCLVVLQASTLLWKRARLRRDDLRRRLAR